MKRALMSIFVLLGFGLLANSANATIVYNDGGVHEINTDLFQAVEIYDGPLNQPTTVKLLLGGEIRDIDVYEHGLFYMTGGRINGTFALHNFGQAEISGGIVNEDPFYVTNNSRLTITGGQVSEPLRMFESCEVYVHGTDFKIDGVPVPYGPVAVTTGRLTGTLLYGQIQLPFFIQDNSKLVLVPEPATILLLSLGILTLLKKRRP